MSKGLMTAKEAVAFLHISMFTLGKIERTGALRPFRTPGGHRRYNEEMLMAWAESTRVVPGEDFLLEMGAALETARRHYGQLESTSDSSDGQADSARDGGEAGA